MSMMYAREIIQDWVIRTFGKKANTPIERSTRLLEETLELAQTEGCTEEFAHRLVTEVFSRDRGNSVQEAGGVALTFQAYCASKGFLPDYVLMTELRRVLNKSPSHFRNRNQQKIQHGFSQQKLPERPGDQE